MADPVSASIMIGSQVVGNFAGARGKAAAEAAQNAATLANFRQQQNREAMASDRQNEKLMDQLYATVRANEFIENSTLNELFSNSTNIQDATNRRITDLKNQAKAAVEANKKTSLERNISPDSANVQRLQMRQGEEIIRAMQDVERNRVTEMNNLLNRRESQLGQRGSEQILGNTFQPGRAPDLYDNSSMYYTSALIQSAGDIAGGIYSYNTDGPGGTP